MINYDVDPLPANAISRVAISAIILEATYLGPAGPAVWNTPGSKRPAASDARTQRIQLNTPVGLDDVVSLRSSLGAGPMLIPGGTNGCDTEVYSDPSMPRLVKGNRYVLFVGIAHDTSKQVIPGGILEDAWPVAPDGKIPAADGRGMTEADFRALLAANPYTPIGGALPSPSPAASPAAFFLTVVDIDGPSVDIVINGTVVGRAVCQAQASEAPIPKFSPSVGRPLPWSVELRRTDGTVLATFVETGDQGPRTIFLRAPGPFEGAYGGPPGVAPAATCAP